METRREPVFPPSDPTKSQALLADILEKFRPMLLAKADYMLQHLPWLRGKCDAADLVQETLIRAHRFHEQFRGAGEEQRLTWLMGILRHRVADVRRWHRSKKRDSKLELAAATDQNGEQLLKTIPSDDPTPSSQCRRRETDEELREALAALPFPERDVLMWKTRDEWTFEQIAQTLGCPVHAARRIFQRALEKLQRRLRLHVV